MSTSIFHTGTLESGISRAIQERKLVTCFVRRPDDEDSSRWIEWLTRERPSVGDQKSLGARLAEKAVILEIDFGSREAGFLNGFCQVEDAPMLAVISNGLVKEKILGKEIEEDEFVRRVISAAGLEDSGGSSGEEMNASMGLRQTSTEAEPEEEVEDDEDSEEEPQSTTTQIPANPPTSPPTSTSRLQQTLSDRGIRLEAERKKREEAEKAARIARSKARRAEAEAAEAAHQDKGKGRAVSREESDKSKARDAWIYEQKKRKDEAKSERERVLAQIEADKEERKARDRRAKEAQSMNDDSHNNSSPLPTSTSSLPSSTRQISSRRNNTSTCALQIRLFDGSSIRSKFPSDANLASTVRNWISETSSATGADQPYTFRQILAPQPSRSIEISEEHESLRDLDLAPSATLVLVPVAKFSEAYSAGTEGYVGSAVSGAWNLAGAGIGLLSSALAYLPGMGGGSAQGAGGDTTVVGPVAGSSGRGNVNHGGLRSGVVGGGSVPLTSGSTQIRVKTLADQRAEAAKQQGAEFYNGNSLRFEGRDDRDEDDQKR